MKSFFLSIAALLFITGLKAQKTLVNDANAEIRVITGGFNSIVVSGGIDLFLSQYSEESIAVSASSDQYKQNIKTVVENNSLKIYYDGGRHWNPGNKKLKVYISFKELEKLQASGGSEIQVAGKIETPRLKLNLSGACNFKGIVEVNDLSMELSGASDVKISGAAAVLSIQSSGASDLMGFDLVTDICNAKASGASDIHITVNKELNVHASGASDILYKGTAIIKDMHSSGASSIAKRG